MDVHVSSRCCVYCMVQHSAAQYITAWVSVDAVTASMNGSISACSTVVTGNNSNNVGLGMCDKKIETSACRSRQRRPGMVVQLL